MSKEKEKCFEEAADKYQEATGKDLNIEHKTTWRQNVDGSWSREAGGFWAAVRSMWKWSRGLGDADSVVQPRVPDLTVNTPKGPLVIDLKFTRPSGRVDDWQTTPGKGNGQTQLHDYNEINRQTDPDVEDLKLDPEKCGCDQRGLQPEYVFAPASDPFLAPWSSPHPLRAPSPAIAPAPVRIPIPIPIL